MNDLVIVKHINNLINDPEIKKFKTQLSDFKTRSVKLEIKTPDNKKDASDMIGLLGKLSKKLDERRKELLQPFTDSSKMFKGEIDSIIAESDGSKKIIESKLMTFIRAEQAEAERLIAIEQERIRKEAEANIAKLEAEQDATGADMTEAVEKSIQEANRQMEFEATALAKDDRAKGYMFTSSIQDRWTAEIIEPKSFILWVAQDIDSRIKYLSVDKMISQTNLNDLAKQESKEFTANGMRFYKESKLVARS